MNAIVQVRCRWCHTLHEINVRHKDDVYRWKRGEKVQNAMPYLSADDRELLISGTCPTCWDKMFGEEGV